MSWGAGKWVYDYNQGWVWRPGSSRQQRKTRKQVQRKQQKTRKQIKRK